MGNEISSDKDDGKSKRSGGLRRSNSLKEAPPKPANSTSPQARSQGKPVKRSSTFSPSSMKRPAIFLKYDHSKTNKPLKKIKPTDMKIDNFDVNGNSSTNSNINKKCAVKVESITNVCIAEEEIHKTDIDTVDNKPTQACIDKLLVEKTSLQIKELINEQGVDVTSESLTKFHTTLNSESNIDETKSKGNTEHALYHINTCIERRGSDEHHQSEIESKQNRINCDTQNVVESFLNEVSDSRLSVKSNLNEVNDSRLSVKSNLNELNDSRLSVESNLNEINDSRLSVKSNLNEVNDSRLPLDSSLDEINDSSMSVESSLTNDSRISLDSGPSETNDLRVSVASCVNEINEPNLKEYVLTDTSTQNLDLVMNDCEEKSLTEMSKHESREIINVNKDLATNDGNQIPTYQLENENEKRHKNIEIHPPDEKKRTIKRRKNRYVRRSQSMKSYHELLPKLLSGDGFTSIMELSKAADQETENISLLQKQKLSRRISDTCLLKEQHIKRSEQFTQMLNEIREKAIREMKPLSPYAKEFISYNKEQKTKVERKFKFEKNRDYFDFWLKDHHERIDNLTKACKGDLEISRLRKSFNDRALKVPPKTLLPQRPHSVKLPRRKINNDALTFSSDSSDNDEESKTNALLNEMNTEKSLLKKELFNSDVSMKLASPKSINLTRRKFTNDSFSFVSNSPDYEAVVNIKQDLKETNLGRSSEDLLSKSENELQRTKIKIRSRKTESLIIIRNTDAKLNCTSKSEITFSSTPSLLRTKNIISLPVHTDYNNNNIEIHTNV